MVVGQGEQRGGGLQQRKNLRWKSCCYEIRRTPQLIHSCLRSTQSLGRSSVAQIQSGHLPIVLQHLKRYTSTNNFCLFNPSFPRPASRDCLELCNHLATPDYRVSCWLLLLSLEEEAAVRRSFISSFNSRTRSSSSSCCSCPANNEPVITNFRIFRCCVGVTKSFSEGNSRVWD